MDITFNTSQPLASKFILYERTQGNNDNALPDLDKTEISDKSKDCFIYDIDNRNIYAHNYSINDTNGSVVQSSTLISGHTVPKSTGVHNEIFNDYKNNAPTSAVTYSFTAGLNNTVKYSENGGGAAFGHYNQGDTSYLFTIGNGANDSKRSNILSVTYKSLIIGYNTRDIETGKYVSIENGDTYIQGNLTVDGKFTCSSSDYDTKISKLSAELASLQTSYSTLNNSVSTLTEIVKSILDSLNDSTFVTVENDI